MPRAGSAAPAVRAAWLQFLQLYRRHYPTTGVQLAPIVMPGELKAVLRNLFVCAQLFKVQGLRKDTTR